jgi:hypothetical protein
MIVTTVKLDVLVKNLHVLSRCKFSTFFYEKKLLIDFYYFRYLEEQLQISFNDHLYNLSLVKSCKKSIRQPVIITEYSTGAHSLAVTHSSAAAHPNVIKESASIPHSSAATQTLVKSAVKPKPVAHL